MSPASVTPLAAQIADVTAATAAPEPPKTRTQSRGMRWRLRLVFEWRKAVDGVRCRAERCSRSHPPGNLPMRDRTMSLRYLQTEIL